MQRQQIHGSARWLKRLAVTAVFAVVMVPTAVIAAGGAFTDDDTSVFEANIEWLAGAGVTAGCNPPDNTLFCPEDNVTRGQMAAFMQRFAQYIDAEDGTPAQADNAATLDGADPSAYQTVMAGASCDTTCPELDDAAANFELLEIEFEAPADGYMNVAGNYMGGQTGPTNDYVSMWATLNGDVSSFDGCGTSLLGIPLAGTVLTNHWKWTFLDGAVDYATLSTEGVYPIEAGTHTLRLCGYANEDTDTTNASISVIWTANGTASVASATSAIEVTPELEARVAAAQD